MFFNLSNKKPSSKEQGPNKEAITIPTELKIHELVDILEKGNHVNYNIKIEQSEFWNTWLLKFNNYKLLLTKRMENKKCHFSTIEISLTSKHKQDTTLYKTPYLRIIHSNYGYVHVSLLKSNLSNGLTLNKNNLG